MPVMDRDNPGPGTSGATTAGQPGASERIRAPQVPPASAGVGAPHSRDHSPTEAFKDALAALGEVREYITYYLAAKADGIKLSFRRMGILAVVGAVGLLAGGAIVATASVLVVLGLAMGLSLLFGGRLWLGSLVVGLLLLLLIGGGTWLLASRLFGSSKKATVKKYELRRQRQRADFGRDVLERARETEPQARR